MIIEKIISDIKGKNLKTKLSGMDIKTKSHR